MHLPISQDPSTSETPPRRGVCFVQDTGPSAPAASAPSLALAMPRKGVASARPGRQLPGASNNSSTAAGGTGGAVVAQRPAPAPLYDPTHPNAVLLNSGQWDEGRGRLQGGRPVVPVVVRERRVQGLCCSCSCSCQ
jgi:hypothetical protein